MNETTEKFHANGLCTVARFGRAPGEDESRPERAGLRLLVLNKALTDSVAAGNLPAEAAARMDSGEPLPGEALVVVDVPYEYEYTTDDEGNAVTSRYRGKGLSIFAPDGSLLFGSDAGDTKKSLAEMAAREGGDADISKRIGDAWRSHFDTEEEAATFARAIAVNLAASLSAFGTTVSNFGCESTNVKLTMFGHLLGSLVGNGAAVSVSGTDANGKPAVKLMGAVGGDAMGNLAEALGLNDKGDPDGEASTTLLPIDKDTTRFVPVTRFALGTPCEKHGFDVASEVFAVQKIERTIFDEPRADGVVGVFACPVVAATRFSPLGVAFQCMSGWEAGFRTEKAEVRAVGSVAIPYEVWRDLAGADADEPEVILTGIDAATEYNRENAKFPENTTLH